MDIFLEKLKKARKLLKMGQVELAEKVGVAQKDISNIENGSRQFIPDRYISFLLEKGIDINSLYDSSIKEINFINNRSAADTKSVPNPVPNPVPNSKSKELGTETTVFHDTSLEYDNDLVNVPIIDIKAAANSVGISMHDGPIETLGSLALDGRMIQRGKQHFCFPVVGDSMEPTIYSGDYIVAKLLEPYEYHSIKDSYIYVISTKNGIVIKRLLNRLIERGQLRARSDNRQYSSYNIDSTDIVSIWEVKARLTFNFTNEQANLFNIYKDLESRIEELERKK